jgi:lactate 2-monooxygenase
VRVIWASEQARIYLKGLHEGEVPPLPTNLLDLETLAVKVLGEEARGYIASSAGDSDTMRENRRALERRRIIPRALRGVAERDLSSTIVGEHHAAPLLIAPVGVQSLAHPDGELATARAAAAMGVTYIHSQAADHSLEEVAQAAGSSSRWFQFYWVNDRDVALSLLQRAQRAGYTTLVITVDTVMLGWRPADLDRAYLPFLRGVGVRNYTTDPHFMAAIPSRARHDPIAVGEHWLKIFPHAGLTWDDFTFVREHWEGPIIVKGIQHPEDARRAVAEGAHGVVVSNHGGRQVDGGVGTADVLESIRDAVEPSVSVLFDSGVRTGTDILKVLAMGADGALVGRSFLYGLALEGQRGVEHVIRCLLAELDLSLGLSGCRSLAELSRDHIRTVDGWSAGV